MRGLLFGFMALLFCASLAVAAEGEKKVYRAEIREGVQRVEVLGGGYYFSPYHIIVKANVPVELVVRKDPGMVPHDIVMKAPEAGMNFETSLDSEPKTIRFTPTKPGTYPFYCSKKLLFFESHREKGMEGVLEVIE